MNSEEPLELFLFKHPKCILLDIACHTMCPNYKQLQQHLHLQTQQQQPQQIQIQILLPYPFTVVTQGTQTPQPMCLRRLRVPAALGRFRLRGTNGNATLGGHGYGMAVIDAMWGWSWNPKNGPNVTGIFWWDSHFLVSWFRCFSFSKGSFFRFYLKICFGGIYSSTVFCRQHLNASFLVPWWKRLGWHLNNDNWVVHHWFNMFNVFWLNIWLSESIMISEVLLFGAKWFAWAFLL